MAINQSFKPKQAVKRFIAVLPERSRDVLISRYGLGTGKRMTLEAIGSRYGITRERVRQIESHALSNIRKSDVFEKEQEAFLELMRHVDDYGGVVEESAFLSHISPDESLQNHVLLLLILGDDFKKKKEDDDFWHRWHIDEKLSDAVHGALAEIAGSLSPEDLFSEEEITNALSRRLKNINQKYHDREIFKRWLSLSKKLSSNPLGEWGLSNSNNVRTKGMRDYAFLVVRQQGSPMHFKEVAGKISELFDKPAHVAPCHNELIKDKRFILVGRGLYALAEWGYMTGVVKDVIRKILEKSGPLSKEEVVSKVMKERYVKENTILVNLQNNSYFKKLKDGRYSIA